MYVNNVNHSPSNRWTDETWAMFKQAMLNQFKIYKALQVNTTKPNP